MDQPQEDKPKIIVDEDWKSQVEAENEGAQQQKTEPAAEAAAPGPGGPLPPASIELLVTALATQALAAMGQLPDPVEGHAVVRPDLARHHIDMLAMIQEKTKGNLTPEEAELIENVLHQIQMLFVSVQGGAATPPAEGK